MAQRTAPFEAYLQQHDQSHWDVALEQLRTSIHEVDRDATRIWFHFWPLALSRALASARDLAEVARCLWLEGRFSLRDHIDTSHRFLYGHRYWPVVREVLIEKARSGVAPRRIDLAGFLRELADTVADRGHAEVSLVLGILAVGVMTLQQVGLDALAASAGLVSPPGGRLALSPRRIVALRERDDWQGPFGVLRGLKTRYTVTFDEVDPEATFRLINTQHLTTAAQGDTRDHGARDPRCHEGPIPVQCRSAFCGSCWVGVLGGRQKLSPAGPHERERLREFGYVDTDDPFPLIRLACQAQAFGNVTLVLPTWNGILSRRADAAGSPARVS